MCLLKNEAVQTFFYEIIFMGVCLFFVILLTIFYLGSVEFVQQYSFLILNNVGDCETLPECDITRKDIPFQQETNQLIFISWKPKPQQEII